MAPAELRGTLTSMYNMMITTGEIETRFVCLGSEKLPQNSHQIEEILYLGWLSPKPEGKKVFLIFTTYPPLKLKLTFWHMKIGRIPKGKSCIPTINVQGRKLLVSGRVMKAKKVPCSCYGRVGCLENGDRKYQKKKVLYCGRHLSYRFTALGGV